MFMKSVGLALGAGGSLGLSEIGVLNILEKNNIPINYISGSSIGAIIGAHYALYKNKKKMEEDAISFIKDNKLRLFNIETVLERKKKIKKIELFLEEVFGEKTFKDCKIPFCSTALDLESGKTVYLTKGRLKKAILASMSIPGVFPPVFYWGQWLVDGGFLDPVPLDYLLKKKLDVLIGVDLRVSYKKKFNKKPNYFELVHKIFNIFQLEMTSLKLDKIPQKIIIRPKYTIVKDLFSLETAKSYIKAGEKGALLQLPKIKKAIKI